MYLVLFRMIVLLILLSLTTSSLAIRCDGPFKRLCISYKLESEVPLKADFYDETHIVLRNASGTISKKTFSLYPDAESLTIYASNIDNITDGALCSPEKLRILHLNYNVKFPNITSELLKGCQNITDLKITNVEPEASLFVNLPNLVKLELARSTFQHLTKKYLEPLKQLKEITIANSKIEEIDPGVLCTSSNLEKIHLENMRVFPSITKKLFENCNNLKELHFSFAGDGYLTAENNSFMNLKKLEKLTLKKLDIKQLSKDYLETLTSLDTVFFEKCNIDKIDQDAFQKHENIKELRLDENNLTDLPPEMFDSLPNLEMLDLSDNKLESLENIKGLPKLWELTFTNNLLNNIDTKKVEEKFPKLSSFDINGNKLECEFIKQLSAQKTGIYLYEPCQ